MNPDILISFHRASVGYGRVSVLEDLDFVVTRGDFVGLLGANGSGKSTILRTILGILPPLSGRVEIHRIGDRPPVIGYVPQRESLDPIFRLSSYEVALMGVYGRTRPGRPIATGEKDWVRQCLEETGAGNLSDRLFASLSGGQKQRVLMARALATRPDFLVLDEPTAGIDASATQAIMGVLDNLHRQPHLTILMVSHELETVRRHAREVIWLHEGRVLQGDVATLLTREKIEEVLALNFA